MDGERRLDSVAQPDELVGHRSAAIEVLDLVAQLPENPAGAVEALLRAQETDVVPHRVAHDEPVLRDQGGIDRLELRLPRADLDPAAERLGADRADRGAPPRRGGRARRPEAPCRAAGSRWRP